MNKKYFIALWLIVVSLQSTAVVLAKPKNIILNKSIYIRTNGAEEITEERNRRVSKKRAVRSGKYKTKALTDGDPITCFGFQNHNNYELMSLNINIPFKNKYKITKVRYNVGRSIHGTWHADKMITPFGSSYTKSSGWTEQNGDIVTSDLTLIFEKSKNSWSTDWLFIGEIEIYGEKIKRPTAKTVTQPAVKFIEKTDKAPKATSKVLARIIHKI